MVNFLQLTMLQLGGEVKLMEKGGVEVGHNRYFEIKKLFSLSGQTWVSAILLPGSVHLLQAPPHPKNPLPGHQPDQPGPLCPVHHSLCQHEVSWIEIT